MATHVQFEVEVKDVEYQQLAGQSWLARVYQPKGAGPFPTIVDVHGGAWNNGDRLNDTAIDQALAAQGILTVAIDFRQPPEAGYPASVCDMNLAIRWLKVHASEYGGTSKGRALGASSGRHPWGTSRPAARGGPCSPVAPAGAPGGAASPGPFDRRWSGS